MNVFAYTLWILQTVGIMKDFQYTQCTVTGVNFYF